MFSVKSVSVTNIDLNVHFQSREIAANLILVGRYVVTMTSLLTATPKYWWGKCPTCPTTDYLPGLNVY